MKKLIRIGTCDRCGKCCEGCKLYKGDGICPIWGEQPLDRGCRVWPLHPFEVPPYCAFQFFDAETGEEIKGYKDRRFRELYAPIEVMALGD